MAETDNGESVWSVSKMKVGSFFNTKWEWPTSYFFITNLAINDFCVAWNQLKNNGNRADPFVMGHCERNSEKTQQR